MVENLNKESEKPKKMTYEQLEGIAHQLSEQCRVLHKKLQEAYIANIQTRLHYLFEVLHYKECFSSEFILSITEEIVDLITLPEQEEPNNE